MNLRLLFSAIASLLSKRNIVAAIYLVFISGITLIGALSVDIYVSVESFLAQSAILNIYALTAASLILAFIGILLFIYFDVSNFGTNARRSVLHTTMYVIGIAFVMSLSTYMQYVTFLYRFVGGTTSSFFLQIMVTRLALFVLGAPILAAFACNVFIRRIKRTGNS